MAENFHGANFRISDQKAHRINICTFEFRKIELQDHAHALPLPLLAGSMRHVQCSTAL